MKPVLLTICCIILLFFAIYLYMTRKGSRYREYETSGYYYFGSWLKIEINDKSLLNETHVKLNELLNIKQHPYVYGRKVIYPAKNRLFDWKRRNVEGFEVLGKDGVILFIEADWVYGCVYNLPYVSAEDMYYYKYDYTAVSKYCFLALHAKVIEPIYNDYDKSTIETVLLEDEDFYGFQMWRYSPYKFIGIHPRYIHKEKGTFARPINLI